jgi:hypothetical protein
MSIAINLVSFSAAFYRQYFGLVQLYPISESTIG